MRLAEGDLRHATSSRRWAIVLAALSALFGIGFLLAGLLGGQQVGWRIDAWVSLGRTGGPLWLHLLASALIGLMLLGFAAWGLRDAILRRRRALERLQAVIGGTEV